MCILLGPLLGVITAAKSRGEAHVGEGALLGLTMSLLAVCVYAWVSKRLTGNLWKGLIIGSIAAGHGWSFRLLGLVVLVTTAIGLLDRFLLAALSRKLQGKKGLNDDKGEKRGHNE
jgi:hypothetical protein